MRQGKCSGWSDPCVQFFFHQMIDTVNVCVKERNAVFVQTKVVVEIIVNQLCGGTV